MQRLFLVRHGITVLRHYDASDVNLSALGRRPGLSLRDLFRQENITSRHITPLKRCVGAIDPMARTHGLSPESLSDKKG